MLKFCTLTYFRWNRSIDSIESKKPCQCKFVLLKEATYYTFTKCFCIALKKCLKKDCQSKAIGKRQMNSRFPIDDDVVTSGLWEPSTRVQYDQIYFTYDQQQDN